MQTRKRSEGKKIWIVILFLAAALFLFRLNVSKSFFHGYFTDARAYENIGADSILGTYDLSVTVWSIYTVLFPPE